MRNHLLIRARSHYVSNAPHFTIQIHAPRYSRNGNLAPWLSPYKISPDFSSSFPFYQTQQVFLVRHLYVYSYLWPNGESLDIPLVCSSSLDSCTDVGTPTLLLHWMQHHWLEYYPFIRRVDDDGELFIFDLNSCLIRDLSSNFIKPPIWVGGRDHWGHTVLDFLPSYNAVDSFVKLNNLISLRPFCRRFSTNIDGLYSHLHLSVPKSLPQALATTLFYIGRSYIYHSLNPSVFFATSHPSSPSYVHSSEPTNVQPKGVVVLPSTEVAKQRIANYSDIMAFLYSISCTSLDPIYISNCLAPSSMYKNFQFVITMYGSVLFNPLLYSCLPLVTLFPTPLLRAEHRYSEQFAPLIPLLGTRIFPVEQCKMRSTIASNPIESSYYFRLEDIKTALQYALGY